MIEEPTISSEIVKGQPFCIGRCRTTLLSWEDKAAKRERCKRKAK